MYLIIIGIQGDSYSFINILTSGRFRSQKALDNKILSHTSKIGKNYHIGFFTISKCHSSLNYSTLRPMYNKCHECHNRRNNCCFRENIGITYKVRFSFILTTMPDSWFQRKKNVIYLQFLKVIVGTYTIQHALSSTILTLEPRHFCKSV
jgi:hypothetical protein